MIRMYDSTNADAIPADAVAVAGYVGPFGPTNRYVSFPAITHRFFGHAHCLSIAAQSFLIAAVLDVETGDARPSEIPRWWRMVRAHGQYRPCFYANASTMPAVKAELNAMGLKRDEYRLWVADWDNRVEVPAGYDAKQYINHGPRGENYDLSVLRDDFFPKHKHHHHKPKPHPKVVGASAGAAFGAAISAVLSAVGVHVTPAEASAISTITGAVSGYVTPTTRRGKR